jgi:hypothetical protein
MIESVLQLDGRLILFPLALREIVSAISFVTSQIKKSAPRLFSDFIFP